MVPTGDFLKAPSKIRGGQYVGSIVKNRFAKPVNTGFARNAYAPGLHAPKAPPANIG